jgi:hypothetical protein
VIDIYTERLHLTEGVEFEGALVELWGASLGLAGCLELGNLRQSHI